MMNIFAICRCRFVRNVVVAGCIGATCALCGASFADPAKTELPPAVQYFNATVSGSTGPLQLVDIAVPSTINDVTYVGTPDAASRPGARGSTDKT